MENNNLDRRIRKTKRDIKHALVWLLSIKSISDITVKELAEVADINRKTFYNHYQNTQEIVDEIICDTVNEYLSVFTETEIKNNNQSLIEFTKYLKKEKIYYKNLFNAKNNFDIINKICQMLSLKLKAHICSQFSFSKQHDEELVEYTINCLISGTFSIYLNWLNHNCRVPEKILVDFIIALTQKGILEFITKME